MQLNDNYKCIGEFSIKTIYADGTFDEYVESNLIMDLARNNMAELIGGVTAAGVPINKLVLGTKGHIGTDILAFKPVGTNSFDSTRTNIFSEVAVTGGLNYSIPFTVTGVGMDVTDLAARGVLYNIAVAQTPAETGAFNTVRRLVSNRTVTYTITIPAVNGNAVAAPPNNILAYTEAALYTGSEIFSMKTFPARVKESTVQLVITWSLIF